MVWLVCSKSSDGPGQPRGRDKTATHGSGCYVPTATVQREGRDLPGSSLTQHLETWAQRKDGSQATNVPVLGDVELPAIGGQVQLLYPTQCFVLDARCVNTDCPCLSLGTFQNVGRFGTCPFLWQVCFPTLHLVTRSPVDSEMFYGQELSRRNW